MEHSFTDWLSGTPFSQAIQLSPWAIPGIQTIHILALAVLFSAALVLSLRVLGRGIAAEPLASVAARSCRRSASASSCCWSPARC